MKYEDERRRNIDTKTATVIAGIIASLSLSLRINSSVIACLSAATLIVPLITLFEEFKTVDPREAPSAESIVNNYQDFPISLLKSGIQAMMDALTVNREIGNRKVKLLDRGIGQTMICIMAILGVQFYIAFSTMNYVGSPQTNSVSARNSDTVSGKNGIKR